MFEKNVSEIKSQDVVMFLNSLYDEMIAWNIAGLSGKVAPWLHLGISSKDYLGFSKNPEAWAQEYLRRLNKGWGEA